LPRPVRSNHATEEDLTGAAELAEDGAAPAAVEEVAEEDGDNLLEVKVYEKDIERALKTLKNRLQKEGLFREIKKRSFYEKPSVKKRRKQAEARKRKRKALRSRRVST
jgi:small subunit ribosomal protein S21